MARISSEGVAFAVGDGASPEVFTDIAEVLAVPPVNPTRSQRDRTALGDSLRQYAAAGLKDPGQLTVRLGFDPNDTDHQQLLSDYSAGTSRNYRIELGNSPEDYFGFTAYPSGFNGPSGGVDEDLELEVTFQLTTEPTLTQGS